MNTRLQVEHPVTEAITGEDLVEWQLRVASGETLPKTQAQLSFHGHAMEARLYAESPVAGFLPSTGVLRHLKLPTDVRVDSGVEQGNEITPFYDPMIAKLIVHADGREAAAEKLAAACGAVEVWPIKTNAAFLARAAAHPDFVAGRIDTSFIGRHPELVSSETPSAVVIALAARALLPQGEGPWESLAGFRPGTETEAVTVRIGEQNHRSAPASVRAPVLHDGESFVLFADGQAWPFEPPRFGGAGEETIGDGALAAPMPGMVTALSATQGQKVKRGEILLVLEAMKMENGVAAPFDGMVAELNVRLGEQVQEGTILIRMERT